MTTKKQTKKQTEPLSPAERAKQLGISQEQFEAQARKQADEYLQQKHELKPHEKLELEKQAKAATEIFEKNFPRNPNWPPFPLPDIFDNDDPHLIGAAAYAIERWLRNFIPEVGANKGQYKIALEIALDVWSAWSSEGLELKEPPLAKNINWPSERDFIELMRWFLGVANAVEKTIVERKSQGKPEPPALTEDETKVLDYLKEEFPTIRCQQEICAIFPSNRSRKTIKGLLDDMIQKDLVSRPKNKQKGYVITSFGHQYHKKYYA